MGLKDKVDIGAKLNPFSVGIVRRWLSSDSEITVQSLNTNTITRTVGTENMFPLRSELRKKNFARTSVQLRSNFGPTSLELRSNFARTSVQLRSNFGPLRSNFGPTSLELRSIVAIVGALRPSCQRETILCRFYSLKVAITLSHNFGPTSFELRPNFVRTSAQLRSKFAKYEFRMVTYFLCLPYVTKSHT